MLSDSCVISSTWLKMEKGRGKGKGERGKGKGERGKEEGSNI